MCVRDHQSRVFSLVFLNALYSPLSLYVSAHQSGNLAMRGRPKPLLLVIGAICVLLGHNVGRANVFTELATWNVNNETGSGTRPNTRQIILDGGATYVNSQSNTFAGSQAFGVTGFRVSFLNTTGGNVAAGNWNVIAATKATNAGTPMNATAIFTEARLAFVPGTGSFLTDDPSTWGNLATATAVYSLKPPEAARAGAGQDILTQFITNTIEGADISQPSTFGGSLVFREIINNFINNSTMTPGAPFTAEDFIDEGLLADFDEQLLNSPIEAGGPDNDTSIRALELLDLNAIFSFFFPGEVFATGVGAGPGTNFDPIFNNGAGGTLGDFGGTIQADLFPVSQFQQEDQPVVPEPASLLIWSSWA